LLERLEFENDRDNQLTMNSQPRFDLKEARTPKKIKKRKKKKRARKPKLRKSEALPNLDSFGSVQLNIKNGSKNRQFKLTSFVNKYLKQ